MPHKIIWVVDKRVLLTTFNGVITAEELSRFIADVRAEIKQGTPLVHHISNSLGMEKVQFSLKTLQTLTSAVKMTGELGWQVDINQNPMNKFFANLGGQFVRLRTRTFSTLDEAIAFLKDVDETLNAARWDFNAPVIAAFDTQPVDTEGKANP